MSKNLLVQKFFRFSPFFHSLSFFAFFTQQSFDVPANRIHTDYWNLMILWAFCHDLTPILIHKFEDASSTFSNSCKLSLIRNIPRMPNDDKRQQSFQTLPVQISENFFLILHQSPKATSELNFQIFLPADKMLGSKGLIS